MDEGTPMEEQPASTVDRSPALLRPRFICPRCDAFAHQTWHLLVIPEEERGWAYLETNIQDSVPASRIIPNRQSSWNAAECASCRNWSIWYRNRMVYPAGRVGAPPHPEMPEPAKELYEEAAAVAGVSRRAGAAMARSAVERLVKLVDPEAPRKLKLAERIDRLKPKVSTPLAQLLDVVRVTGNSALHGSDDASEIVVVVLDDEEGPAALTLLLEAANMLVDELIARPREAAELWSRLPESIRKKSQAGEI
jgi:hypothetical protein